MQGTGQGTAVQLRIGGPSIAWKMRTPSRKKWSTNITLSKFRRNDEGLTILDGF